MWEIHSEQWPPFQLEAVFQVKLTCTIFTARQQKGLELTQQKLSLLKSAGRPRQLPGIFPLWQAEQYPQLLLRMAWQAMGHLRKID